MSTFQISGAFSEETAELSDVVQYDLTVGPSAAVGAETSIYLPDGLTSPSAQVTYAGSLFLDGASAAYAEVQDSQQLDITGDIEIRCKLALDDWTPATEQTLISKWGSAGSYSYRLFVTSPTGMIGFQWSNDGTTINTMYATAFPSVANGQTIWIRVTLDVNNGYGGATGRFFTSTNGSTWTQLGNQISLVATTSIFSSNARLLIGSHGPLGTDGKFVGKINRVEIFNSINGQRVLDADFESAEPGALSANSASKFNGYGFITKQISLTSANNYLATNSSALEITGDIEFVARLSLENWKSAFNQAIIAKKESVTKRCYNLTFVYGNIYFDFSTDGTYATQSTAMSNAQVNFSANETKWIKVTVDSDNGSGGRDVKFYYADDQESEPSTWTQLGSNVTVPTTAPMYSTASLTEFGTSLLGADEHVIGIIKRIIVRSGIGGVTVFDGNMVNVSAASTSFIETANNATVSVYQVPNSTATTAIKSDTAYLSGNALVLGGAASRNASTPSTTALSISGDIDIACRAGLSQWQNSTQTLVSKYLADTSGYEFSIVDGYLKFTVRAASTINALTAEKPNLIDGNNYWIRVTRVAATGVITFYIAPDSVQYPTSWTTVGTTAGTSGNIATTSPQILKIGETSVSGQNATGKIYRVKISNSINGTAVFDADFSSQTALATSFTSSTGQVVTINSNGLTPSLTALPRIKHFDFGEWRKIEYGNGQFTLYESTKLRILAIASSRGIQTLRAVVALNGYTTAENHSSISITPVPADLGSSNLDTREVVEAPCPPSLLDVNALKSNSFDFSETIGNWKIRSGNGILSKSVEKQKYLDINSLLVTSSGGADITLSTDSYNVEFEWNSTIPRFGAWVYSTEATVIDVFLNMRNGLEVESITASKSIRANYWTWVAVETSEVIEHSQTLYVEGQFVVSSPSTGTKIFFSAPVLVTTDSVTQNEFSAEIWLRLPEYFRNADAGQVNPNFPLYRFIDVMFSTASQVEFLWDWISYVPPDDGGDETSDFASNLVNPDTCCPSYLPWLADIFGVTFFTSFSGFTSWNSLASKELIPEPLSNWTEWQTDNAIDTDNDNQTDWFEIENFNTGGTETILDSFRWQVKTAYYGLNGGTCKAMAESVAQTLSGTKSVQFVKHTAARQGYSNNPWILVVETLTSETPDVSTNGQESASIISAIKNATPAGLRIIHRTVGALTYDDTVLYEISQP